MQGLPAHTMINFKRLEPRHFEVADLVLGDRQVGSTLANAAKAAFRAANDGDEQLRRRAIARACSEIESGVWKNPEKCEREIAMHILGDIRHQKLLLDKIEIIDKEKTRGATPTSDFSHLSKFDQAIVKQMLAYPVREDELRLEAAGRYEVLDPAEQIKLRADFEDGTYLTSPEIHRIGLEISAIESGKNAEAAAYLAQSKDLGR